MKIHKGDKVQVITGKDKGKIAEVLRVFIKKGLILVEGINLIKKHVKPGAISKEGGIVTFEKPIDVSNVMYYSEKLKRPVRLGYKLIDGKKVRYIKPSGDIVDSKVKSTPKVEKVTKSESADKKSLKKKAEKK